MPEDKVPISEPQEPQFWRIADPKTGDSKITSGFCPAVEMAFMSSKYEVTAVRLWT